MKDRISKIHEYQTQLNSLPLVEQISSNIINEYKDRVISLIETAEACRAAKIPVHSVTPIGLHFGFHFNRKSPSVAVQIKDKELAFGKDGSLLELTYHRNPKVITSSPQDILLLSKFYENFPLFEKAFYEHVDSVLNENHNSSKTDEEILTQYIEEVTPFLTEDDVLFLSSNNEGYLTLSCMKDTQFPITIKKDFVHISSIDKNVFLELTNKYEIKTDFEFPVPTHTTSYQI